MRNRKSTIVAILGMVLILALAACAPAAAPATAVSPTAAVTQPTSAPTAMLATTPSTAPTTAPTTAPAPTTAATTAAAPTTAAGAKVLRMGIGGDESTLQPYTYVTGYPGWNMLNLMYDTLFLLDANNVPKPWLATEDKVSADGKVHTITLREGVKWQDGTPLTSADVKFSYEYFQKNTHSRWSPPVKSITSIETPDAKTVVITLSAPNASFALQPLADAPIIPQAIWKDVTETKKFENNVGTGPYKLVEYKPDEVYRFEANPDYFQGKPAIDELVFPIIKGASQNFAALQAGEIDATAVGLSPELVKDFETKPDLKVQEGPGYATMLLQFNDERAPWNKAEVREAVALAIDRKQLVDTVLLGYGVQGNPGWVHPASPLYDAFIKPEFDPAKAKTLLDGLGYKAGSDGVRVADGKPMQAEMLVNSDSPTRIRTAELIAAGLKDIGITVKITTLDPDSVDAKVWTDFDVAKGRDFDMTIWSWSAPVQVSPARMIALLHSDTARGTLNIGGYKNPAYDKIADELAVTTDFEKQKGLVMQLSVIIAQDAPFVTLYYQDGIYTYRPTAYDQWVYQKGQGIFNKLSFLPGVTP